MSGVRHDRVVVLGMHRSGTSAVTRVLNLLGLPLCREDDLYAGPDNPSGHWESRSLMDVNDRVLREFGGASVRPPSFPAGWEATSIGAVARAAFDATYAGDAFVFKDPRTCLTLPMWRRVLDEPLAAVIVVRSPEAVAQSLATRDRMVSSWALGIWERYTRSAIVNARGLPTFVVRYEDLVADPQAGIDRLAAWVGSPLAAAAAQSIDARLSRSEPVMVELTAEQHELVRVVDAARGPHDALDIELPSETPNLERRWHLSPYVRLKQAVRVALGLARP